MPCAHGGAAAKHDPRSRQHSVEEQTFALAGLRGLGAGEAACIALAYSRQYRFVTDDRLARRTARRLGVPITGTLGLLTALVDEQVPAQAGGDEILRHLIGHGYRSPVEHPAPR